MFTSNNGIFDTSVKTDCIIARLVLVGWLLLVGILLSCYITDTFYTVFENCKFCKRYDAGTVKRLY